MPALSTAQAAPGSSAAANQSDEVALLRAQVRLLRAVIDNFPGGISLFDEDLRMVLCNDQQKAMLEYPDSLFEGQNPSMADIFRLNAKRGEYGPGDVEDHVRKRLSLVHQRLPHSFERTRPNGRVLEIRGVPIEGGGFVTTYQDVTERRRDQALIAHMAHHDALTDLPNRVLFADRLSQAVARARREGCAALHCIDLDHFKPVNDRLGHQAGDELLRQVAARLRVAVRDHDTVARLGGDEFAVVQTGIATKSDAAVLASRLVSVLSRPFDIVGQQVSIGTSIGIAVAPEDSGVLDDLVRRADDALYAANGGGRNRYVFAGNAGCVNA